MKFDSDIDIDFASRDLLLPYIDVTHAAIRRGGMVKRHPTGIYPTDIPYDPINDLCALDYNQAEKRGYNKIDLLNVWVYKHVRDENHLVELMCPPPWERLLEKEFCEQLIHIGNYHSIIKNLVEPINSIQRLMMFVSLIRPGKKHLIGLSWSEVAKTIWEKPSDGGYTFKRAHACAYAHLIVVNINLLIENGTLSTP